MNKKKSDLMYLAATLAFAVATFQIANGNLITGALMLAVAACFTCAGKGFQNRENAEVRRSDGYET